MTRPILISALSVWAVTTALAAAPTDAQDLTPSARQITVVLNDATLEEAMTTVATHFGLTVEFSESVSDEHKHSVVRARFTNAAFRDVIGLLLDSRRLTYTVTSPTAIRIEVKAP